MDELFKNKSYKILEIFIERPSKNFSLRDIARELGLAHNTVPKYIYNLEKLGLIKKNKETLYPTYFANTQNEKYKFHKRNYLVSKLMELGIVEKIQKETLPSSIILFGSGAKATFTEESDIDIFVEAKEQKIDLRRYEKKLGRRINLLFEPKLGNLSEELRNNIINGVILYGFVRLK